MKTISKILLVIVVSLTLAGTSLALPQASAANALRLGVVGTMQLPYRTDRSATYVLVSAINKSTNSSLKVLSDSPYSGNQTHVTLSENSTIELDQVPPSWKLNFQILLEGSFSEGDYIQVVFIRQDALSQTAELINTQWTGQSVPVFQGNKSVQVVGIELTRAIDLRFPAKIVYTDATEKGGFPEKITTAAEKAAALRALTYPYVTWRPAGAVPVTGEDVRDWTFFVKQSERQLYQARIDYLANTTPSETKPIDLEKMGENLPDYKKDNAIARFLTSILALFAGVLATIMGWEMNLMMAVLGQADMTSNSVITSMWKEVRDLLNLTFIVILLAMALSNILGFSKDNYGIKKNLPKLILMVIAINFSKLFVGIVLDFANVIEATIYGFAGMGPHGSGLIGSTCTNLPFSLSLEDKSLPCQLGAIFKTKDLAVVGPAIDAAVGDWDVFMAAFVMVFLLLGSIVAFLGICLILLARTIAIWFLIITSPIFFVGQSFEPLKKIADSWKSNFFKYAFMHVKLAFFLAVGIKLIESFQNGVSGSQYYTVETNSALIPDSNVSIGPSNDLTLNSLLLMIFMFAMIWMGVFTSMKSDISPVDDMAKKFGGWGKSAMKGAALNLGIPGHFTVKDAGKMVQMAWAERKKNLHEAHHIRASKGAVNMTKGANWAISKTTDRLPRWLAGKWLREEGFGLYHGTPQLMERTLRNEQTEASKKRTGEMDTPMAIGLMENALHEKNSGDFMNAVLAQIHNQDNHNGVIAATMQALAKGIISRDDAVQISEKGKGFHVGFLAIQDLIEDMSVKGANGKATRVFDKEKVKHFVEKNLMKDGKENLDHLSDLFFRGNITVSDGSQKMMAEFNRVAKEKAKINLAQRDPENSNLAPKSTKQEIDLAFSRKEDGSLEISEDRIIRTLLSIADRTEMKQADADNLNVTDLAGQKTAAREVLGLHLAKLKRKDLEGIIDGLQKSVEKQKNYTAELNPLEKDAADNLTILMARLQAVLAEGDKIRDFKDDKTGVITQGTIWEREILPKFKTP